MVNNLRLHSLTEFRAKTFNFIHDVQDQFESGSIDFAGFPQMFDAVQRAQSLFIEFAGGGEVGTNPIS